MQPNKGLQVAVTYVLFALWMCVFASSFGSMFVGTSAIVFLMNVSMVLVIVGILIDRLQHISIFVHPRTLSKRTIVLYVIISFLLAYFYVYSEAFLLPILWIFFYAILPSIVAFFERNSRIANDYLLFGFGVILIVSIIGIAIAKGVFEITPKRDFLILNVSPRVATHGTSVTLSGFNFGWKESAAFKVMTQYGEIPVRWENDKTIVFEVPPHVKTGTVRVWIERPRLSEETENAIEKSNEALFQVRSSNF